MYGCGADVGTNPELVRSYSEAVSSTTKIPFIAKMTPNITDMCVSARAAVEGGSKGLSAINTVKSITNIDLENMTAMPVVDGKSSISGYSGAAALVPLAVGQLRAMRHVGEEYLAHTGVDVAVVDEEIALEIVLEAAEIEVCRAGRDEVVVDDHRLGVEHSRVVEIDLDAGLEALRDVRERGVLQHPRVAAARNHDAHVYLGQRSGLQGVPQGVRREEVRGLDILRHLRLRMSL